jgi:ATPase subunit of ABC transporter with duplicated ATPase domains
MHIAFMLAMPRRLNLQVVKVRMNVRTRPFLQEFTLGIVAEQNHPMKHAVGHVTHAGLQPEAVRKALADVGFTEELVARTVSNLSGGEDNG